MTRSATTFAVNDRVSNPFFGTGTISQVDAHYTTVLFDENGSRKFLTTMVQLEHSSTAAPVKPVRQKKVKPAPTAK